MVLLVHSFQYRAAAQNRDSTDTGTDRSAASIISPDQVAALEQAVDDAPADPGRRLFVRFSGVSRRERGTGTEPPRLRGQIRVPLGARTEAAISAENDSGEPLDWNPSEGWLGADHVAGYVSFGSDDSDSGWHLVAGRYRAVFGRGLLIGNGSQPIHSAGRAGISPGVRADIRGYAGFSERPVQTGLAVSLNPITGIGLGSFISRERLTASIRPEPDGSIVIRDVSTSGLHANRSARSRRGLVTQTAHGGWVRLGVRHISLGFLVGRSATSSDYRRTSAIRDADGVMFSAAGSIAVKACEMAGEAVIEPGTVVDTVVRCRTDVGTVFAEWTRETVGPAGIYGRAGRLVRDSPVSDVLRAGWHRRFSDPKRSIRGRLAVSGGVSRPRHVSAWTTGSSGRVRLKIEAYRQRWKFAVSSMTRRRLESTEHPLRLAGESYSSGRMLIGREERMAAQSLMMDVSLLDGTSLRVGYLRSRIFGSGGQTARSTSGSSMSVEVDRDNLFIAAGVLTAASSECVRDSCSLLQAPRIYVYERGVQNAFGLASAGASGIRGVLTAAIAPDGPVTLELQIRHQARVGAELNEVRAARIGAPPASTTVTVQLTIR